MRELIAPGVAIILVLISAMIAAQNGMVALSIKNLTATQIGTQLLMLSFIALVIERAVEVYVNNRFAGEQLDDSRQSRLAGAKVKTLQAALDAETARALPVGVSADQLAKATNAKQESIGKWNDEISETPEKKAQFQESAAVSLDKLKVAKRRAAMTAATFLAAIVALSGVHTLTQLVDAFPADAPVFQTKFFMFADTVLTAFLLAGGADGIHQIVKKFTAISDDITAV